MVDDLVASEMPIASLALLVEEIGRDLTEVAQSLHQPSTASIDPAALIDAARRLAHIQGALRMIDQPGLAALTQLVRDQLISAGQNAATTPHPRYMLV